MKRVHELARELGVSSKRVLDAVRRHGYVARSASSVLPDEISAAIRADLQPTSASHAADEDPVLVWLRQRKPDPEKTGDAAVLRFLTDSRSIPRPERRQGPPRTGPAHDRLWLQPSAAPGAPGRRMPPPGSSRSSVPTATAQPETAAATLADEVRRRWPSVARDTARALEAAWVRGPRSAIGLMGLDEVQAWWAAGLGPHDHLIAWACIRAGLRPSDLSWRLDGRRVVERLRGGETADAVAVMLQEIA